VTERCSRIGRVCPDRKAGRPCSGWHGTWEPRQLDRFDALIVRAASADLLPVKVKANRHRAYWFWVPSTDLADLEPWTPDDTDAVDPDSLTARLVSIEPRLLDRTCRYGEDTAVRSGHSRLG